MKKLLFILALLFAGCREEIPTQCPSCFSMIFSDALPVQFWLNNCETYNERQVCGINNFCFCQPFHCDDEIKTQFVDTFNDYVIEEDIVEITLPALETWVNSNLGFADWVLGAIPQISLTGTIPSPARSEYLYVDYPFESGKEYSLTLTIAGNNISGLPIGSSFFVICDNSFNELLVSTGLIPDGGGTDYLNMVFTATEQMTRIAFRIRVSGGYVVSVRDIIGTRTDIITTYPDPIEYNLLVLDESDNLLDSIPFVPQLMPEAFAYVYTNSWIPNSSDVCNQKVKFQIEQNGSPDSIVAKSDCIDISETGNCTELILYSNNRNYDGLIYNNISPDQEFYIRVPARFFHERNDEEDEVMQLSSSFITLNSTIQAQKLFEVIHAPYYWHRKLQLIFKHDNITIDDQPWIKNDRYEINEGNKRGSLKSAQVWLTQKDNIQRNVFVR